VAAKAIFIGGTASNAGKSWFTTAVCRYLRSQGYRVAPFKAQNMSNNSYPCAGGGEIGRAQVAQAEACGLEPEPAFNPILLKPTSDRASQVVVNGRVWKHLPARAYYEHFEELQAHVLEAYAGLAERFDAVVIEGAGSVAELNLKSRDLVNLSLAERVGARAVLVSDIDRGGVFASIIGTMAILEPREQELIRTFAVNRFRGDRSLFDDGVRILEERTGRPCLGVFPHAAEIHLDEEDGFAHGGRGGAPVAIVAWPRISNVTDFRLFREAAWITGPVERQFKVVFLPGTKSTLGDLAWLRAQGLDEWILRQHRGGARIIGICGGYQMLGRFIHDEGGFDGAPGAAPGLGLLPVVTVMEGEKTTVAVTAAYQGMQVAAYEIHMGRTEAVEPVTPFAFVNGQPEGACGERCVGTYLHGALEDHRVASALVGFPVEAPRSKEESYEALGKWFAENADLALFEKEYLH
jgi:adenosylcobyric acid synthase